MKILIYMGHPAHFHLFKRTIQNLEQKGHAISILIKKKDILEDLLISSGMKYHNILPEGRGNSRIQIAIGVIKRDFRLFMFCLKTRPDMMIGTSVEIGHVGTLLGIPSVNVNEDDHDAVPFYSRLSYPFVTCVLSPAVCNNGKWERKSIKYNSYHELAYLHPSFFKPDREVVAKYIKVPERYFLLRFSDLSAHHDRGIRGISNDLAARLIEIIEPYGMVYITSERKLDSALEKYRIEINPLDIHHIISYATLFVGDSQTMAAEAGVLGTPFIRYNDFAGRLGYLKEMEEVYKLGFSIKSGNPELLLNVVREMINSDDLKSVSLSRRDRMIEDKLDLSEFLTDFLEGFPGTIKNSRFAGEKK